MDTEIRARVESVFVEECAKRTLNDILREKDTIMEAVREDVFSYFENKGITITVLGMKDGLEYDDPAIQQSINEKFSSEQRLTTQENENKRIVSEAEAIAEANKIISDSITESILRKEYIDKWDGVMPKYTGDSGNIILPME
jgi:hypothetical protein